MATVTSNCLFQKNNDNILVVYNAPKGYEISDDYSVKVRLEENDWIDVPVYFAEVTRKNFECNRKSFFASVDLCGAAEFKITPKKAFTRCRVRPESDGIVFKSENGAVGFSVDNPCQLSVEFDGDIFGNLQLFVNPIESYVPDKTDPDVIYLEPGIHTYENCPHITLGKNGESNVNVLYLESNTTLYIAGGAVLKAMVIVKPNSENIKILGRGIIDLLDYNVQSGKMAEIKEKNNGMYPQGLSLNRSKNLEIDGIIIKNSCSYAIMGNSMNNVTIDNVKLFNRCDCSDGIDFVASSNITIKNCYIRSNDDGIAVYASRWEYKGSAKNWLVDNCVFMVDCAHGINIGTHGSQDAENRDEICDIVFRNLDFLDVYEQNRYYWGVIAFTVGDENFVHDITFENIRVYPTEGARPFTIKTDLNKSFNPNPGYRIENIHFRNIEFVGTDYITDFKEKSLIKGCSPENIVTGLYFENVTFCGEKLTEQNYEKYFDIGENAENINFN